jgi:N-methylhydantoinase B/oxoprolinase/acetone carboxylase alpha subunit
MTYGLFSKIERRTGRPPYDVFCKKQPIAWVGARAHQLVTGGMSFGSCAYGATGIQQEAMLLPGLKLVEKGEIRQDIWRMRFMTGQALVVDGGASHF